MVLTNKLNKACTKQKSHASTLDNVFIVFLADKADKNCSKAETARCTPVATHRSHRIWCPKRRSIAPVTPLYVPKVIKVKNGLQQFFVLP